MLTRRAPERGVVPLRSALEWFFQDPWQELGRWQGAMMPSIDLRDTDDAYVIEAEMPGVKPEDVEVTLEGNTLLIRGKYEKENDKQTNGDNGRYIVRERESATYARAISLPGGVDASKVTSTYENGELRITLPKAPETRARKIPISGGTKGAKQVQAGATTDQPTRTQSSHSTKATSQTQAQSQH
jgi:HSP20 family protein